MRYPNNQDFSFKDVKLTVDQYLALKEMKYLDKQIAVKANTSVARLRGWKKLNNIERIIANIKKERLLERRSMIH
ncbi:hypothetical protein [Jeotgalibacillus aurantiacus]|uniref:hypothetical protein n=1 Tax=Jeotgalibacillus aurantiacus TaxID=2763266 RepID=UPI001D0AFAA0|nr:hypothetical protein [Jeotgalibacillus aurantiacus]